MDRHVEVEHVADIRDVQAACSNVGCHQQGDVVVLEIRQHGRARALVHVAVEGADGEAVPVERTEEIGDILLAVAEDDRVLQVVLGLDDVTQDRTLLVILGMRGDETLGDGLGRGGGRCHLDSLRVLQETVRELLDLRRHGRREEQGLAGERDELRDSLDIGDEAHVEHAVGLVDHEDFDAGHEKLAALAVVEQATGGADQHIGATLQLAVLFIEGDAADEEGNVELVILAVLLEVLGNLGGEFARRLEDERARHSRTGATLLQKGQHRQDEGGRLARPRLGDAADVTALQRRRNGALLDRRRRRVASVGDGREDFLAQAKISKCSQRENCFRSGSS